jgi:CubicO group peptidase (beta-lactamase class C family)
MRAGTRFDEEDYADPHSDGVLLDQISGYRTRTTADLPPDTYAWIRALRNDREHGSNFKYRSILTDVLGWVATSATGERFADLFADRVWSRIGAEHDAAVIVDDAGFPVVEGGICVTPRDLARFGLLWLEDGTVAGRRVVPASWTARLRERDGDLVAAFAEARRDEGRSCSTTTAGGSSTPRRASGAGAASTASASWCTTRRGRSSPPCPRGPRRWTTA